MDSPTKTMLHKRLCGVPLIKGKQFIAYSICSCIFVIEARLVRTANSMGTSQFIFVFSTMLFGCQETHQLLNGLSNSSCWSSAIWSISLFLVKSIMWLYCAWNSALLITIPRVLGRGTHIHTHTLTHMRRSTCMPLRAQSFRKRKQLRAGTSSL